MPIILLVLGIIAAIAIFFIGLYNSLVTLKARVDEAWSQIDVQLKRRTDLIPNLVETVKGYAAHEKGVFEEVTKARSSMMSATTPGAAAEANNALTGALKSLFAVAENYPDLKASTNFLDLQQQVGDTEDKIAYSRQFYNNVVMDFNVRIKSFPNVLFAPMLGYKEAEFFKTIGEEREPVKVQF